MEDGNYLFLFLNSGTQYLFLNHHILKFYSPIFPAVQKETSNVAKLNILNGFNFKRLNYKAPETWVECL